MPESPSPSQDLDQAADVLLQGGVIAIPTDTVYGLAASINCPEAIDRIYQLKGRDRGQPIPILISKRNMMTQLGTGISSTALRVAECFWPGAITIVVRASSEVPSSVLAGGATVGLRIPDSVQTLQLIKRVGGAIAVTSANRSGMPEARSVDHVLGIFGDELDLLLDGGRLENQEASTVLDLSGKFGIVRREGSITRAALSKCVPGVFP